MVTTAEYLKRIGFSGEVKHDYDTIKRLIECHSYTVPYENIDIIHKKDISLNIEDILDKVVTKGRGGYCFELNYAFSWLLKELEFNVTEYFARFLLGLDFIPMPRHRILEVTIDDSQYICDVGVGLETLRFPKLVADGHEQDGYKTRFDDTLGVVLSQFHKGEWSDYFSYNRTPALPVDFISTSYYCEHSPESIFNKDYMIAIKTPTGRKTIDGNVFKVFDGESVTVVTEDDEDKLKNILQTHFFIEL